MRNLDHYQGRSDFGLSKMFSEGFRAGKTRDDDIPLHFVRIGGFTDSRVVQSDAKPGLDCILCMATAARKRQWVETIRLSDMDPPSHER